MDAALSDILVIDLSRVFAGPYCTMMLGDLGAKVIKVEQPGKGDDTRHFGPPQCCGRSGLLPGAESQQIQCDPRFQRTRR